MTVAQLKKFCDEFQRASFLEQSTKLSVALKYGKAIDQDLEDTNRWESIGPYMQQSVPYVWDHSKYGVEWDALWPDATFAQCIPYRASIHGWSLSDATHNELKTGTRGDPDNNYFSPDSLSMEINPMAPTILASNEVQRLCYGMITISISGYGCINWQPFFAYREQILKSPAITTVLRLCREHFPVPPSERLDRVQKRLGELFFNQASYQSGDWILSINETG